MKVIKGDLIDLAVAGKAKVIVHGCNCFNAMGSGIAGALASRFPSIPKADRAYLSLGTPEKLGSYSIAHVTTEQVYDDDKGHTYVPLDHSFHCINLYTQFKPGPDFILSVFEHACRKLNKDFAGQHLWFPMIGCGIGGGDWTEVMQVMLRTLTNVEVTVVVL